MFFHAILGCTGFPRGTDMLQNKLVAVGDAKLAERVLDMFFRRAFGYVHGAGDVLRGQALEKQVRRSRSRGVSGMVSRKLSGPDSISVAVDALKGVLSADTWLDSAF